MSSDGVLWRNVPDASSSKAPTDRATPPFKGSSPDASSAILIDRGLTLAAVSSSSIDASSKTPMDGGTLEADALPAMLIDGWATLAAIALPSIDGDGDGNGCEAAVVFADLFAILCEGCRDCMICETEGLILVDGARLSKAAVFPF